MTHDRSTRKNLHRGVLTTGALALAAALLAAGCGGGGDGLLVPEASATQTSVREQAAMNRAMSLNAAALTRGVKGERPTKTSSQ